MTVNLFFDEHMKYFFQELFSAGRRRLIANGKRVAMKSSVNTHNCEKISACWHAHWPVFIALVFTFFGWIFYHAEGSYIVNVVGAVGLAICLPLFKFEKKLVAVWCRFFAASCERNWSRRCSPHCRLSGFRMAAFQSCQSDIYRNARGFDFICSLAACVSAYF